MLDQLEVFETRVRERAFHLWQEAGCPEETAEEFYYRARAIELDELKVTPQQLEAAKDKTPISEAADFA